MLDFVAIMQSSLLQVKSVVKGYFNISLLAMTMAKPSSPAVQRPVVSTRVRRTISIYI